MNLRRLQDHIAVPSGLFITILMILWQWANSPYSPSLLNRLDYILYDWRLNSTEYQRKHPDHNIVILDIDERSLKEQGRWPWSRAKVALLLDHLAAEGAIVVGFDVLFSEPEANPVDLISPLIDPDRRAELLSVKDKIDPDLSLARAFDQVDVVLSSLMLEDNNHQVGAVGEPIAYLTPKQVERSVLRRAAGYTGNLSVLADRSVATGFFNPIVDSDGVIRRVPLIWRFQDEVLPSLALAMGMTYLFQDSVAIKTNPVGAIDAVEGIEFTKKIIRTDGQGGVMVPYIGPKNSFTYLSATDVLNNRLPPGVLENAVVLVGTTAVGLFDLRATPVGTEYAGVEIHANVLNGLLNVEFPFEPAWSISAILLIQLVMGVLISFVLPRFGPIVLTVTSLAVAILFVLWNFYLWQEHKLVLPMASVLILVVLLTAVNLIEGFWKETHQRRELQGMFGQYVPRAHIDRMLTSRNEYDFKGENKELTVLFSDIRSFTTISEQLSATELKELLNRFFTPTTEIIFNTQGTIDKYVGDMVMAFWGAPVDDPKHAEQAVEAAILMLEKCEALKPEFQASGFPEVNIGIGINTGFMNVGDMGSNFRRAYTVLGDAVNLGSRLEGLTKFYGVKCLVGPDTYQHCPSWQFRFVDRMIVKGKDEPIDAWEPLGLRNAVADQWQVELERYQQAYEAHLLRNWDEALNGFNQLIDTSPRPQLYQMYVQRIHQLREMTLPDDWQGVFRHTSK